MLTMKRRILPVVLVTALCLCLALLCTGCSGDEQNTAAKFGDHTISEDEVTSYTDEFRAENDLTDDVAWAQYLRGNALTGKTWREQAIRTLADRLLIEDKAKELGISADEDEVSARISQAKQQAGVADDDDAAWSDYLSSHGTTPEKIREDYEFTSVEEQVFRKELNFDDELEAQMCDDYISQNLSDRVVRRYSAIVLDKKDKAKGQELLGQLKGLSGSALSDKFSELAKANSADSESAALGGDIGWDFTYSEGVIDPKAKVRYAQLKEGELYPKLVKGTDGYRIMLCTGVVRFAETPKYEQLPDESSSTIRQVIEQLTLASTWAGKCQEYLRNLEDDANIQVAEMPSGLSYDLVEDDSTSSTSSASSESSADTTSSETSG